MKTFFFISLVFSCLATKTDLNPTQNVKIFLFQRINLQLELEMIKKMVRMEKTYRKISIRYSICSYV